MSTEVAHAGSPRWWSLLVKDRSSSHIALPQIAWNLLDDSPFSCGSLQCRGVAARVAHAPRQAEPLTSIHPYSLHVVKNWLKFFAPFLKFLVLSVHDPLGVHTWWEYAG